LTRTYKNTIADRLHKPRQLINATTADAEIQELVAFYGYSEAEMANGQRLHDAAVQAVAARAAAVGARGQAVTRTQAAEREARDTYQALSSIARAMFPHGSSERATLGITGPMPVETPAFVAAAATLYSNAGQHERLGAALAQHGGDQAAFQRGQEALLAFQRALHEQDRAKGNAVHATAAQREALDALGRWAAQYAKIARTALRKRPELLRALNLHRRTARPAAQEGGSAAG
jgi:hypothetical protein